jgi:hypothetical protein
LTAWADTLTRSCPPCCQFPPSHHATVRCACYCRSPPPHLDRGLILMCVAGGEALHHFSSPTPRSFHLCSALLPPFSSPSPANTAFSCFHPRRASALLSLPLPLALAFGPSRWPTKPGNTVHRPLLPTHEFTVDCRHPCTSGPTTTSRRTIRARSSSTSTPTSPMTFCLCCHHRPLCCQTPTIARLLR